jgi:hypothetical protein
LPSRPGEFHPKPLTDPDVILSHHPARATARRLPPSAEHSGSSRFDPVGPGSTPMTCPLCSAGITPPQRYYGAVRPSPAHRYFRPRGWRRLCLFPWHRRQGSHVPYDSLVAKASTWRRSVCTTGRFDDKAGSMAGILASDSAVLCSIALQYGASLEVIRRALVCDPQERSSGLRLGPRRFDVLAAVGRDSIGAVAPGALACSLTAFFLSYSIRHLDGSHRGDSRTTSDPI